jgi:hypothetical protein
LTEWDKKISNWIIKALQENDRLGRNKMYDYVNRRYRRNRKKKTGLSKDVFDKHLKFLLQNSIVCKNDLGQRGTTVEHFLCPEAILQLQSGTLDLIAIKNQDKNLMEITPKIKLKSLYILILIFNHTTSFEFKNEDKILSFLKPLHLKIDKEEITKNWREIDENDSEVAEKERRHFRTRIQSQDKGVTISIHEYANCYHDGTTNIYNCQVRGMTKKSVIANKNDNPFQHLSFSSDQIDKAFNFLRKDQVLHRVPNSEIYRIIDSNLYFLLFFLEDLFTEYVMPVMRKIWRYLRRPTAVEKQWLVMLYGKPAADIIIREDIQHRLEMDNETRKNAGGIDTGANKMLREKKKGKRLEIEDQLEFLQEELNYQMNAYKFIIDKHKFLQDIFEMIFPEFLRHLKLS